MDCHFYEWGFYWTILSSSTGVSSRVSPSGASTRTFSKPGSTEGKACNKGKGKGVYFTSKPFQPKAGLPRGGGVKKQGRFGLLQLNALTTLVCSQIL